MPRYILFPPCWRSAVIVDVWPEGSVYVGADPNGWFYRRDGSRLVTMHGYR